VRALRFCPGKAPELERHTAVIALLLLGRHVARRLTSLGLTAPRDLTLARRRSPSCAKKGILCDRAMHRA
jgi:hypothetical protein